MRFPQSFEKFEKKVETDYKPSIKNNSSNHMFFFDNGKSEFQSNKSINQ